MNEMKEKKSIFLFSRRSLDREMLSVSMKSQTRVPDFSLHFLACLAEVIKEVIGI